MLLMRKLLLTFAGAVFAVSTVGGVAFAKSPNAQGPDNPNAHGGNPNAQGGPDNPNAHHGNPNAHVPGTKGPDPTGHAKKGLCNAYSHNNAHAKANGQAFKNLAAAAGSGGVAQFCAG
jgi:hypothetical protein